jgi:hypothetical protein
LTLGGRNGSLFPVRADAGSRHLQRPGVAAGSRHCERLTRVERRRSALDACPIPSTPDFPIQFVNANLGFLIVGVRCHAYDVESRALARVLANRRHHTKAILDGRVNALDHDGSQSTDRLGHGMEITAPDPAPLVE